MVLIWQTSYSFKLLYTESRTHHKALTCWYSIFPCGTSLLIWKQFIFMFQIGPANSYQNIRISSQVWNYGPCLTNFIQLSSICCKLNSIWHSLYHTRWITYGNGYSQCFLHRWNWNRDIRSLYLLIYTNHHRWNTLDICQWQESNSAGCFFS